MTEGHPVDTALRIFRKFTVRCKQAVYLKFVESYFSDRHEGGRKGRGAYCRRGQEGRQGRYRRQARRARRQLFRADGADRCDDRHGHHQGGGPGRPARPLQDRCRGNQVANGAPTLPPPLAGESPGRRPQGYGLEVRSGLPVSRSTGTETCS